LIPMLYPGRTTTISLVLIEHKDTPRFQTLPYFTHFRFQDMFESRSSVRFQSCVWVKEDKTSTIIGLGEPPRKLGLGRWCSQRACYCGLGTS
jgi:hypothetical protein